MVTHSSELAARADRKLHILDGKAIDPWAGQAARLGDPGAMRPCSRSICARTLRSLRRTPGLSSVMIANWRSGLAIWIIAYHRGGRTWPAPMTRSDNLFHVDWGTLPASELIGGENYQRVLPLAPHMLLSDRDATRLAEHPAVRAAREPSPRGSLSARTAESLTTAGALQHA